MYVCKYWCCFSTILALFIPESHMARTHIQRGMQRKSNDKDNEGVQGQCVQLDAIPGAHGRVLVDACTQTEEEAAEMETHTKKEGHGHREVCASACECMHFTFLVFNSKMDRLWGS